MTVLRNAFYRPKPALRVWELSRLSFEAAYCYVSMVVGEERWGRRVSAQRLASLVELSKR